MTEISLPHLPLRKERHEPKYLKEGETVGVIDIVTERAQQAPARIAFPEATAEKMLLAIDQSNEKGICIPVLVGVPDEIKAAANECGVDIDGLELFDTTDEAQLDAVIERYVATNPLASVKSMKRKSTKDPFFAALMLTSLGDVDATFAGLDHTTGDVIMGGQLVVGMDDGISSVSSMGIWEIPDENAEGGMRYMGFGDSAVCTNPTAEELAGNAICAAETMRSLLGIEPRVALLSFSTTGSAEHDLVDKVREAVAIANEMRPDLHIDGEFQLDAAICPDVAEKKVKRESEVAGNANVVMFPDLNAGNIGVKLVQQFAHINAPGPFLLGLKKVVGDCSRGAPVEELVGNIAVCSVRAKNGGE